MPAPFLWGVYDGENYHEFQTAAEVVVFLRDKRVIVYAHNGGKFDYHYLRDEINSDDPLMVISGRLAKFKIGEAEFRDSINILVNPLRAFAKEEIDYSKLESDVRAIHREEISRYLRSDCVNLWETISAYNKKFGSSLTQAGASMRYWRKHYKVPLVPQTAAQSEYYRDFYFGGRVQCFTEGNQKENFSVVDINSAYPRAMLEHHPLSPTALEIEHLPGDEKELGPCMIRLDAIAKGCFPLRGERYELYFPDDETTVREYCVTGWELAAALEFDAIKIINIKEIRKFPQVVNFAEYINHFYSERLDAKARGDKVNDVFAKLFMNSLYGKFAANPEKYKEYVITHADTLDRWCNEREGYHDLKAWGDRRLLVRDLPESKHRYYNVATAASITGFVRAELFKAMRRCSGVLYCDTDSIAAREIQQLPMGDQLGQWKLELVCDEYAIAGKKLYAFHGVNNKGETVWKQASKGVKLSPEQIVAVSRGEAITFTPEVPTYSFQRNEPIFISREIKKTVKDISRVQ